MAQITVTAKDDLGFSPIFGEIKKGQQYTIEEEQFASELFKLNKVTKSDTAAVAAVEGGA